MIKERFINFYMDIARRTAELSRAKRLQVGAIVVKDDRIISIGYNGMPSGWDNDCEYVIPSQEIIDPDGRSVEYHPEQLKTKPEVLHAERNSLDKLAKGNESGAGAVMFCTHSPCLECAKSIYGAGIRELYYDQDYRSVDGVNFLEKCKVTVIKV